MKEVIDYKAGGIQRFQNQKDDSIKMSSAARDATLIVTTFYPELKDDKNKGELIRQSWLKWREWFYNRSIEQIQPDKPPFSGKTDMEWPPEEMPEY